LGGAADVGGHQVVDLGGYVRAGQVFAQAVGLDVPQPEQGPGAASSTARSSRRAIAAAVLFAVLALLWLLAARGDRPEYRRASRLFVAGTAACAVLLAGTALLPAGARIPAWGLLDAAYLAGFAAVIFSAPAQMAAHFVTDALIDRFGTLTIIVLGETLTGRAPSFRRNPFLPAH